MIKYVDKKKNVCWKSGRLPRETVQEGNMTTECEQEGEIWAKEEEWSEGRGKGKEEKIVVMSFIEGVPWGWKE